MMHNVDKSRHLLVCRLGSFSMPVVREYVLLNDDLLVLFPTKERQELVVVTSMFANISWRKYAKGISTKDFNHGET